VLQRHSANVLNYLDRANRSHELALASSEKEERAFYESMEASWMRLAASSALVERVDLFLHTRQRPISPANLCTRCGHIERLTAIQAGKGCTTYSFECEACGGTDNREVSE
jgi:hypothetical protein